MKNLEIKKNILQEIMELMDAKEGESLKKHPKFMAAKVEVEKPAEEGLEMESSSESPEAEALEEGDITPEQLQKLLEHFKDLK